MTSPTYEIRPSRDSDGSELHRCLDEVARERRWLAMTAAPPTAGIVAFRQHVVAAGGIDLIAVAPDDSVIGWIDVQRSPWEGMRHVGALGMGVRRDWRRRGVGRTLLDAAVRAADAASILRIELEVFASNTGARALYNAYGFHPEGRKRSARIIDGAPDDVVLMARLSHDTAAPLVKNATNAAE